MAWGACGGQGCVVITHRINNGRSKKKTQKTVQLKFFEPHFFCVCFVPRGHCYFCFNFSSGKNFLKPRKHRIIGGSLQRVFAKLKQSVNPNIPNQLTRLMDLDQQTPSVVNDDFFCPFVSIILILGIFRNYIHDLTMISMTQKKIRMRSNLPLLRPPLPQEHWFAPED